FTFQGSSHASPHGGDFRRTNAVSSRRSPEPRRAAGEAGRRGGRGGTMDASILTRMEVKVARLISLSCTTRQIGAILGISEKTVANHRWQAMKKLGVHTMAALTRVAVVSGISSLDDRLTDDELSKLSAADSAALAFDVETLGERSLQPSHA